MGKILPGNIKPEEFDWFHCIIGYDSCLKIGASSFIALAIGSYGIALPPILNFGSE